MLSTQLLWLFVLALPVACIAWTFTHEEIFLETRQWCIKRSRESKNVFVRKSFYLLTCEYCFSHYVVILFLLITHFTLLLPGWRGYLIAGFSLVWIANIYMSLFNLLRQAIKAEKTKITLEEKEIKKEPDHRPSLLLFGRNGRSSGFRIRKETQTWEDM